MPVLTRPHEKSRYETLRGCENVMCKIVMFIREPNCPGCGKPGTLLRGPFDGRGDPTTRPA